MGLAQIKSGTTVGVDTKTVTVEVDLSNGLPSFLIVGLPDKAVDEAKERVKSAIKNSYIKFPNKRITVNLAPADIKKAGPAYDLPIAIGLLSASEQIAQPQDSLFFGELALNGDLRPINGAVLFALLAKSTGITKIYLPTANALEASLVKDIEIIPVDNLKNLIAHLRNEISIPPQPNTVIDLDSNYENPANDMKNIAGQEHAKRALEIAATGRHNILMTGPPGSGKTMLAKALISILPPLTMNEMLEVTKIYSVSGMLTNRQPLIKDRPFRSPHHTSSAVAITGGGNWPKPGEISLAHRGVLFLDELPEFPRQVLEVLRQPLEDKNINISRAALTATFPANFMLVASQNPCPCGWLGDENKNCICTAGQIQAYQKRVSGPLLDRIDIHIQVPNIKYDKFINPGNSESSKTIRNRIGQALNKQKTRFQESKIINNSEMSTNNLKKFCRLTEEGHNLMRAAMDNMNLTGRAYTRTLKVARTIADLDNSDTIQPQHLAEALSYRLESK